MQTHYKIKDCFHEVYAEMQCDTFENVETVLYCELYSKQMGPLNVLASRVKLLVAESTKQIICND